MFNTVIDARSETLSQALAIGDSQQNAWADQNVLPSIPAPLPDGFFKGGHDGVNCPSRLMLLPYLLGGAGLSFSVRVYGWKSLGVPDNSVNTDAMVPYFLAEFLCTSCNRSGFYRPQGAGFVRTEHSFCDTIALTAGALGMTGEVVSTGPGSDLIAFAMLELRGARFFSFDFQQADPVAMNCLFARA